MIGTSCLRQKAVLKTKNINLNFDNYFIVAAFLPHFIFAHSGSALLNEVIVSQDKEVHESRGAGPSLSGSWNEVFQRGIKSDGRNEVLLLYPQSGYKREKV